VVVNSQVDSLLCEDKLCRMLKEPLNQGHAVDEELYELIKKARGTMAELFEGESWATGEDMKTRMMQERAFLQSLEPDMDIETNFFIGICGGPGADSMRQAVIDTLPDGHAARDVDTVYQHLLDMSKTELYKLSGTQAQKDLKNATDMVQCIKDTIPPNVLIAKDNAFLTKVVEKLGNFAHVEVTESGATEIVFGMAAVTELLSLLQDKHTSNVDYTNDDVQGISIYRWLLDATQRTTLDTIGKAIWEKNKDDIQGIMQSIAGRAASASGSAVSVKQEPQETRTLARLLLM